MAAPAGAAAPLAGTLQDGQVRSGLIGRDLPYWIYLPILAVRLYRHTLGETRRAALGTLGECLFTPLGRLLDRHGKLTFVLVLLVIAASIAGRWFGGRPVPGLPIDG